MAVELPCDVALERADDLALGAALARAALDVAASAGVVDHADHDDSPERLIGGAVPATGESWGGKTSCGPFVLALKTAEDLVPDDFG